MTDVIHNPDTDWCACDPGSDRRCGYRLLADTVGDAFNVRDGDEAEVSLCMDAVEIARAYIQAQPCTCTLEMVADWEPCPRCHALGQLNGKPVQR
jgi:hypothetical protein